MSTDVDRLNYRISNMADIWALLAEVGIGLGLLWRQLGAVSIAPIVVTLICFGGQSFVSRYMPDKQKAWLQAISARVKFTLNLLRSMKSVKLTGLVEPSAKLLQAQRIRELHLAKGARTLTVVQNVIGNLAEFQTETFTNHSSELSSTAFWTGGIRSIFHPS